MNGKYFTKIRDYLKKFQINELINLKDIAFDVIVETVILNLTKQQPNIETELKICLGENNIQIVDKQLEIGINPFELQLPSFVNTIINSSKKIKDYCMVYRGVETKRNSEYISTTKFNDDWKEILLGKDIQRYNYHYSGSYVKFIPKELKSNANIEYYLKEKILMRRTGNSIIACADYDKFIALKNLYLIIPYQESYLPLILIQLNSKLFDFIHKSLTTGENKAFAQFPAHYIEELPCRIDEILICRAKQLFEERLTQNSVENKIDQLVYQLYNLTEEEIRIIENN